MSRLWRNIGISLLASVCAVFLIGHSGAQDLQPGRAFRDCPECPEMVVIPAGTFRMGSSTSDYERDLASHPSEPVIIQFLVKLGLPGPIDFAPAELPQHTVNIPNDFAMSKYPVTVSEFLAFVRETGYAPEGDCVLFDRNKVHVNSNNSWQKNGFEQVDRDPVVCMRMKDARAYVGWLNKKMDSGKNSPSPSVYRLPSEAEWEYAARAGTTTAWWWGNQIGRGYANCDGCDGTQSPLQPTPVGTYRANPFGLYDMLGNVWQIVSDCWNPNYDYAPQDGQPWLTGDCSKSVQRGGSFNNGPWSARSASRLGDRIKATTNATGFRVARTIP